MTRRLTPRAARLLAVASIALLIAAASAGTALLHRVALDRVRRDYTALATAEEALATQQQDANWASSLGLDPGVRARLEDTCRRAVAAYNRDAQAARVAPLNAAAHCR